MVWSFTLSLLIGACTASENCINQNDLGGYEICYTEDSSVVKAAFKAPIFNSSDVMALGLAHLLQKGVVSIPANGVLEGFQASRPDRILRLGEGDEFFESYVAIDKNTHFLAVSQYVLDSITVNDMDWLTKRLAEVNEIRPHYEGNKSFAGFLLLTFVEAEKNFLVSLESALNGMAMLEMNERYGDNPTAYQGYQAYRNTRQLLTLLELIAPNTDHTKDWISFETALRSGGEEE